MRQTQCTLLFLIQSAFLFAQNTAPGQIICGNEVFSHLVQTQYPDLQHAFDATFEAAAHKARQGGADDRSTLTIEVVVHVVWKTAAENLADSVIENQIAVLNEDFNRLNADTANLRQAFKASAGNAGIQFKLAKIVRRQTSTNFTVNLLGGSLLAELKQTAKGGSDAWDPQHYLNIWICNIRPATILGIPLAQILGFAFPPNGLSHWPDGAAAPTPGEDGVVIDYHVFGRNNPNTIAIPGGSGNLVVRGRTPTHEVGHYLGLRHIWGDGGLLGANDCQQSDGVDDTPFASAQSNFDCDKTKNTCSQVEAYYQRDMPDLIENYMDYASESCMNMFTKGQVAIMRSVLDGPRSGLVNSVGTGSPVTSNHFRLVPNPSNGLSHIYAQLEQNAALSVRVTDANGRSMYEIPAQEYPEGSVQINLDTQKWPAGLYFVQVQTTGSTIVRKLQVSK